MSEKEILQKLIQDGKDAEAKLAKLDKPGGFSRKDFNVEMSADYKVYIDDDGSVCLDVSWEGKTVFVVFSKCEPEMFHQALGQLQEQRK